jgi:hypothetical protein
VPTDIPRRPLTAPSLRVLCDLLLRIEAHQASLEAAQVHLAADIAALRQYLAEHSDEGEIV